MPFDKKIDNPTTKDKLDSPTRKHGDITSESMNNFYFILLKTSHRIDAIAKERSMINTRSKLLMGGRYVYNETQSS